MLGLHVGNRVQVMTAAPQPVRLDAEHRAALNRLLLGTDAGQSRQALSTLVAEVESSMTEYLKAARRHDQLSCEA